MNFLTTDQLFVSA